MPYAKKRYARRIRLEKDLPESDTNLVPFVPTGYIAPCGKCPVSKLKFANAITAATKSSTTTVRTLGRYRAKPPTLKRIGAGLPSCFSIPASLNALAAQSQPPAAGGTLVL